MSLKSNFKKVVWLASYPKSGNTWVRAFITAYFMKEKELDLNTILPFSDADEATWKKFSPIDISSMTVEDFSAMKPSIIMQMIVVEGGKRILVKTHDANIDVLHYHYLIPALFTLGAIYIIRDPRDIVTSLAYHVSIGVPEAAEKLINKKAALAINKKEHELHQIVSSWNNHVRSWTEGTIFRVQMIRYEDLIHDPNTSFKVILKYLGIEYNKKPFKNALKQTKFGRMQMKEKKDGFKEQKHDAPFFRKGKAEGWRTELPKHLVYKIEEQCHVNMEKYGYKLARPFGKYLYETTKETFKGHEHRKFTT